MPSPRTSVCPSIGSWREVGNCSTCSCATPSRWASRRGNSPGRCRTGCGALSPRPRPTLPPCMRRCGADCRPCRDPALLPSIGWWRPSRRWIRPPRRRRTRGDRARAGSPASGAPGTVGRRATSSPWSCPECYAPPWTRWSGWSCWPRGPVSNCCAASAPRAPATESALPPVARSSATPGCSPRPRTPPGPCA